MVTFFFRPLQAACTSPGSESLRKAGQGGISYMNKCYRESSEQKLFKKIKKIGLKSGSVGLVFDLSHLFPEFMLGFCSSFPPGQPVPGRCP